MRDILDDIELRILGCLIEKELTTPEYYPLTLNALTNACNQKSNRDPVMMYSPSAVSAAVEQLRDKGWVATVEGAGSRTIKYRHWFLKKTELDTKEMVVLAELMLRGPQTIGEIRGRASRMQKLESLDEVSAILGRLSSGDDDPWVMMLPRQAGRKEHRFTHLLGDKPEIDEDELPASSPKAIVPEYDKRLEKLEREVAGLREEVSSLRDELGVFKSQFD